MNPQPTKSQVAADAYRRGAMDPATRARYEEAVRRGIVADPYAAALTGYLTTAARAVPGLTELGAGYSAALNTADDALNGRRLDFGGRWSQARADQQGVVDQFRQDHPIASNVASALGAAAPAMISAPLMAERALPTLTSMAPQGLPEAVARFGRSMVKGALTGAATGAVSGFSQPGTLDQRAAAANAAVAPGAVLGAASPLVVAALKGSAAAAEGLVRKGEQQVGRPGGAAQISSVTPSPKPINFPYNMVNSRLWNSRGPKFDLDLFNPHGPSVADEGVGLTPGQRLGDYTRTLEDRATNLPILGPAIRAARARGLESFNRAVANRVLAHIGESLPDKVKPGLDTAAYLRDRIMSLVDGMNVWPDYDYNEDRESSLGEPENLSPDQQREYRRWTDEFMAYPAIRDDEDDREFDGYSGKEILEMLSNLGNKANEFRSQGGSGVATGEAIEKFGDQVRALAYRQQPEYINEFDMADRANAVRLLMDQATDAAKENGGIYTPADLMAAIRARYSAESNPVSPEVGDLFRFADRAHQAMGSNPLGSGTTDGFSTGSASADAPPQSRLPPAPIRAALKVASIPYNAAPSGGANAFGAAPSRGPTAAGANNLANAFAPMTAGPQSVIPPAIAAGVGARIATHQNDQDALGYTGPR